VRPGQPITFTADTHPGRPFTGTVKHLNPSVSEADRSVRVVAQVPNPSGELQGGTFVRGRIETGRRAGVVLVPRSSLVSWDTAAGKGALLVVEGDRARRREVATGAPQGGLVEVASGLAAGDRVIARGGFTVQDGDRVSVAAAE
jgi:RND family efflux transporter MFP subunit